MIIQKVWHFVNKIAGLKPLLTLDKSIIVTTGTIILYKEQEKGDGMPYVERITRAGRTIEIDRFYTSRYKKKGIKRGDRVKATKESQLKVNARKAERILRLLLAENFKDGDFHINFGYIRKRGQPERTKEQMRKDINVFLRELRKIYKANGKELKYIHVMELGERGARHHHLVINHIDTRLIQSAWKKAYPENSKVHISPLDTNGDYSRLAAYLIKYTNKTAGTDAALQGKRWNCSKNLSRPEPEYRIIKDRNQFSTEPKPKKGYYIDKDSIEIGVHSPEFCGYGYLHYRMIKLE